MNLYRFLLHSSWVAIAMTIFFPSSARSAEVSRLSAVQKNGGVEGNNREQPHRSNFRDLRRASGSAADLIVSPRSINIHSESLPTKNTFIANQTNTPGEEDSRNTNESEQISQKVSDSSASGRSVEFTRPSTELETGAKRNIFQYIRNDQSDQGSPTKQIQTEPKQQQITPHNSPTKQLPTETSEPSKTYPQSGQVQPSPTENTYPQPEQPTVPSKLPESSLPEVVPSDSTVNQYPPENSPAPINSPEPVKNQPPADSPKSGTYPFASQEDLLKVPTNPEQVQIKELQSLTLEQTLEIAKRNNPEFQAALLKVKRGYASLKEARAELYPKLNLNGSIENSRSASDQLAVDKGVAPPQTDEAATTFSGQAEFRYSIFTSGRRDATIREAEENLRVNKLDVEEKYQTLRLNTTLRYYDLQSADEQVRIGQSAVENAQASLRDAQSLERAGVGTKFDVLRSQVNLANAQQDITNALSQQRISRRRLATLLSLPSDVNIATAEPVKIAGLWEASLEESVIQAFDKRSELQQRLAERNIGKQRRRQALAAKGPQVDFVATYDLLDQYNDDAGVADGYAVGVKATLNLYDGGAARARADQAKADIAIAETNFASQRDQIRFEVEQYYSQLQSNQENVQTATTALEQATEALRLARLRFQAGVGTQTDVISAENDLTRAEGNRITAILDYNRALANLERAVAIHITEKN